MSAATSVTEAIGGTGARPEGILSSTISEPTGGSHELDSMDSSHRSLTPPCTRTTNHGKVKLKVGSVRLNSPVGSVRVTSPTSRAGHSARPSKTSRVRANSPGFRVVPASPSNRTSPVGSLHAPLGVCSLRPTSPGSSLRPTSPGSSIRIASPSEHVRSRSPGTRRPSLQSKRHSTIWEAGSTSPSSSTRSVQQPGKVLLATLGGSVATTATGSSTLSLGGLDSTTLSLSGLDSIDRSTPGQVQLQACTSFTASPKANSCSVLPRHSLPGNNSAGCSIAEVPRENSLVRFPQLRSVVIRPVGSSLVVQPPPTSSLIIPPLRIGRAQGPLALVKRWLSSPAKWRQDGVQVQIAGHSRFLTSPKTAPKSNYRGLEDDEDNSSHSEDEAPCVRGGCSRCMMLSLCSCLVATAIGVMLWLANPAGQATVPVPPDLPSAAALLGPLDSAGRAAFAAQTKRAKALTERYVELRFKNDVERLEDLFAEDIQLHVDLSRAGMFVAMKVKSCLGFHTDLTGRETVASYYRALPTEAADPMPPPESFRCSGDVCIVTCTVRRSMVGVVTDIGRLHWDPKQEFLRAVDLTFWSR